jgi:hypothetical protein
VVNTPESDRNNPKPNDDLAGSRPLAPQARNTAPPGGEQEKPKQGRHYVQYWVGALKAVGRGSITFVSWADKNSGFVTALATVVIAALTGIYVHYSRAQWRVMTESNTLTRKVLNVTQQAYITIGRKDGAVAELVPPTTDKEKVGIIGYFQNSGHLPAQFNWGSRTEWVITSQQLQQPGTAFVYPIHHFEAMWAGANRKTGAPSASGTVTIAGDSLYSTPLAELSKDQADAMQNTPLIALPTTFDGLFDYCDGLGNYTCRQFTLAYLGKPYNRFTLSGERECTLEERDLRERKPELDYFPACEFGERERQWKQQHHRP